MIQRRYVFPGVMEMNYQSGRRMGVNIYLIDGGTEYALIDVGFLDELPDVLELIRQMNFSLSACKMIIATHADVDHTQGLTRAREVLSCQVAAHPKSVAAIEEGDEVLTYARIDAQNIRIPMPRCKVDRTIDEGDRSRSATRSWRSGARPAIPPASSRSGWATSSSPATTSSATAAWVSSTPTTARTSSISSQPEADPRLRRRVPPPLPRAHLPQG